MKTQPLPGVNRIINVIKEKYKSCNNHYFDAVIKVQNNEVLNGMQLP